MKQDDIRIAHLGEAQAAEWRHLRLIGLRESPDAFGMSVAEEEARSLDDVAAALADTRLPDATFGARLGPRDGDLVGHVTFTVGRLLKMRHKGLITGLYVREAARGRGVARALMQAALDHATAHVELVQCSVTVGNAAARALYVSLGFVRYGLEPAGMKVDGRDLDEEHLWLALPRPVSGPQLA